MEFDIVEAAAVEAVVSVETEAVAGEDEDIVSRLFLHDLDEVICTRLSAEHLLFLLLCLLLAAWQGCAGAAEAVPVPGPGQSEGGQVCLPGAAVLPAATVVCTVLCQAWREFISGRVWGAAPARRLLTASLARAWRHHQPRHTVYTRTRANPVPCPAHFSVVLGLAGQLSGVRRPVCGVRLQWG